MSLRVLFLTAMVATGLAGCSHRGPLLEGAFARPVAISDASIKDSEYVVETYARTDQVVDAAASGWGEAVVVQAAYQSETDGRYLLDTGDKLRVFIYGQPNLSRIYTVDQQGMISVPLIGNVTARGLTTYGVDAVITEKLGRDLVRDPQVTVDIQENRPFFILGEVRNAGQYPFVSGMTIETAIAIAGGYSDRASDRKFRITRRDSGLVETHYGSSDYAVKPGDTVFVYERFF